MPPEGGADERVQMNRALAHRQRRLRARIAQQRDAWACGESDMPYSIPSQNPSLAELGFALALHACRSGMGRRGPLLGAAFALLGARIAVIVRRAWADGSAGAARTSRASPDPNDPEDDRGDDAGDRAADRDAPCRRPKGRAGAPGSSRI